MMRAAWLPLVVAMGLGVAAPAPEGTVATSRQAGAAGGFGDALGVAFVADGEVMRAVSGGYRIELGAAGVLLSAAGEDVARMRLVGAALRSPLPVRRLPGNANYLVGGDPRAWRIGVARYAEARYVEAYPGIDWVFREAQGVVAYDFVVAPAADAGAIGLGFAGAESVAVGASGELRVRTARGEVVHSRPRLFQLGAGGEEPVDGGFVVNDDGVARFRIGDYDRDRELVIDPAIGFSSYFGGMGTEDLPRVALGPDRSVVLVGTTASVDLPVGSLVGGGRSAAVAGRSAAAGRSVAGAELGGNYDAFVAKLDPSGSRLEYVTYVGGSAMDRATGVVVAADGAVWVAGQTMSTDFPGAANPLAGPADAFLVRLSPDGTAIDFCRLLGGGSVESAAGLARDADGFVYLTGSTASADLATVAAAQATLAGGSDAFAIKFDASGDVVVYATYIGGSGDDAGFAIAADGAGSAYLTGATRSPDFPLRDPLQADFGGEGDAFVVKLERTGEIAYASVLGGSLEDVGLAIDVDAQGAAYVTGQTASPDFPTMRPYQRVLGGATDAFVTKIAAPGRAVAYSTFLGGRDMETGGGIAVDGAGNAHLTGLTASPDFPTVHSLQPFFGGGSDVFVARFNDSGSALRYSTYSGGGGADAGIDIVVDASGNAYVVGQTGSEDFPTFNPVQPALNGPRDAFVTKYCLSLVFPEQRALASAAGGDAFSVTTPAGCVWMAFSEAPWIRLTTPNVVAGPADVEFEVAANATGVPRVGIVNIAGAEALVTQGPASDCAYSISPRSENYYMEGGVGRINVATGEDCAWTAVSRVPWLSINGMERGTGSGAVSYTVEANRSGRQRSGVILIAGHTFVVFDWIR